MGEQIYVGGISSEVLEQQNSESFGCRGVLVLDVGLYTYLIHWLLRELFFQHCVESLSCIMVDEYIWLSIIYIVYLTCHIYIYKMVLGEFSLCRWKRCIPKNFGEKQRGRRSSLDQLSVIGWVKYFFLFHFCTLLKLIVCKVRSKLVTLDPRLQGCLILNNNYSHTEHYLFPM